MVAKASPANARFRAKGIMVRFTEAEYLAVVTAKPAYQPLAGWVRELVMRHVDALKAASTTNGKPSVRPSRTVRPRKPKALKARKRGKR